MTNKSMRLTDHNGTEFQMSVAGYEYPQLEHEPYDSDWLKICVKVDHPRGSWSEADPCLLTWELVELATWLQSIADNNPEYSNIEFMEPELSFEWIGKGRDMLRIHLNYSLRPRWPPYHGPNEEKDLFVEFTVTPDTLRKAAASLYEDTKLYSVRVRIGKN